MAASQLEWALDLARRAEAGALSADEAYLLARPENILYTSCLQCLIGCGIKVKLFNGLAVKVDGSPYSPFSMAPSLPMATPPTKAAEIDAAICPKGHAGVQTVYDPYRITKVLKRSGKRGEGKWATIPFDRAVDEIVNGGRLFRHVPGEENREVAGLKEIYALRDPEVARSMAADVKEIAKAKDKKRAVEEFKRKHAANLKHLIDPDHPDLGPGNNQLVYQWGRKRGGRIEFGSRFFNDYFGTMNNHSHTAACVGSMQFAGKALSEQYQYDGFAGGLKGYWGGDIENAAYILAAGTNILESSFGPTNKAPRITRRLVDGTLKITVVDPRHSKLASKAQRYLPVKPGEDAAFFQATIRWIIENRRYDARYLASANRSAAREAGEPTWTNAALLVRIGPDGKPGRCLRASEIGLAGPEKRKDASGRERSFEYLVAMNGGTPVAVDPNDAANPVMGDLLVDTEIKEIRVKSGLRVIADAANERSMEEWSGICGIGVPDIEETARELTSHGKKAFVDIGRGVSMHTNGFYNVLSAMTINILLGNFDWKGGMIVPAAYNAMGGLEGQPFDLARLAPRKFPRFGISVARNDIRYEDTTLFAGYPAKRNWYPLSADLYMEILPSMEDAYPYPGKALFTYTAAPTYTLPAGHDNLRILADVEKVPLYFTTDILVGPTTLYADYIFPDLSYLERWEMAGSQWSMPAKVQPMRQPVIAPLTETVTVFGEEMPCSYEALLLALAEKLGLPGFGRNGFGPGEDFTKPDDFYIRMVANVATDGRPVPDADDEEMTLFFESRKHLPKTVFDPERWEKIAGPHWRKVVFVLNRGGRYQDDAEIYEGDLISNRYGKSLCLYQEKTAGTINAFTGRPNPGHAVYIPVSDSLGRSPEEAGLTRGYPLRLLSYKDITQTKSRTITNYWLLTVLPENVVQINPADAVTLGLKAGDIVRIASATNKEGVWDLRNGTMLEMRGKVKPTETIMPGTAAFTLGHGHWASGSTDMVIDGKVVKGDPKRAGGFNANAAMWLDPYLKNTCFIDPVGGSVSFYDTRIRLEKA
jgi:anaerobic selenocysteine-containing dehydrogenase